MPRSNPGVRHLVATSVLVGACALAVATSAGAEPGFGGRSTIPMPGTKVSQVLGPFDYEALDCLSAGSCVAVGPQEEAVVTVSASARNTAPDARIGRLWASLVDAYGLEGSPAGSQGERRSDAGRPHEPTQPIAAATETSGTWAAPSTITPPVGAVTTGTVGPSLDGVSCTSVGTCEAVGEYPTTAAGATAPMLASESSGTWSAVGAVLPSNAVTSGSRVGDLARIQCLSAANCVATGRYLATDGLQHAYVAVETAGTWAATELPDVPLLVSKDLVGAGPLVCTDLTDCQVLGIAERLGGGRALITSYVWTETAGVWSAPVAIAPTKDDFAAFGLACPSTSTCLVVGGRDRGGIAVSPASIAETSGTWGAPRTLPIPRLTPLAIEGSLTGVACRSTTCEATGLFLGVGPRSFGDTVGAATWTDGAWSSIGYLRSTPGPGELLSFDLATAVVCPPSGTCVALVSQESLGFGGIVGADATVPLSAARPVTAPKAPVDPRWLGVRGGILAVWFPPYDDGGAPVTGYTVTVTPGGATCRTVADACAIHGLDDGHRYHVTVTDRTSFGTSARVVMRGLAIAGTPPNAPRGLRLREVDGRLRAEWHAAGAPPGEPVEHYVLVLTGTHYLRQVGTKSLSCWLRVRAPGRYEAVVVAVNESGHSKASGLATATFRRPRGG